jgi:hypothetical protein
MTHDELLIEINRRLDVSYYNGDPQSIYALRAVVQLHKPLTSNDFTYCPECQYGSQAGGYPCKTIQAIEKELV